MSNRIQPGTKRSSLTFVKSTGGRKAIVSCDCGKELEISLSSFGSRKSCGCVPYTRVLGLDGSDKNAQFAAYRNAAKVRSYSWNITRELFDSLVSQNCEYCNASPVEYRKDNSTCICNGLDRVDNNTGYEPNNVVPCCKICNLAKRNMGSEEFISWAKRVVEHAAKKAKGDS